MIKSEQNPYSPKADILATEKYNQFLKDHSDFCMDKVQEEVEAGNRKQEQLPGRSGDGESWDEGCGEGLDMGVARETGFPGHGPKKRLEVQDQGTGRTGAW